MKTTAIMNLKGGTAKTVTAINTAAILARDYSMRVLLVDADSQANLTELTTRTTPNDLIIGGFADLMRGQKAFPLPTKMKNVDSLRNQGKLIKNKKPTKAADEVPQTKPGELVELEDQDGGDIPF